MLVRFSAFGILWVIASVYNLMRNIWKKKSREIKYIKYVFIHQFL